MRADKLATLGSAPREYILADIIGHGTTLPLTVLNVPALRSDAFTWFPVVVAASLVLAAPAAWLIAPRLRARYWQRRAPDHAPFAW